MGSYIQNLFADRIGGSTFGKDDKIYKFEKIKRAKREAVGKNPETKLIDVGVGEPDAPAFDVVVQTLQDEAGKMENRGYSDNGITEFQAAAAQYLKEVFDVGDINPDKQIVHAIGAKSALSMFPACFINPGDIMLMTVPGYPVCGTHTAWYGGDVHNLPLKKENNFLPDLSSISPDILNRAKVMVLNYPNNPTGAKATESFFSQVVDFAKENEIVIIQDAAYSSLIYNDKPLSFLSIPGAIDVGVEIHSLSKSFNMTGWRIAFVAGNELLVNAFASVKDNFDSGQFIAIQKAAVAALQHPEITTQILKKYERRLTALVGILSKIGFEAHMPGGTFYLYVEAPKGIKGGESFESGEDFSQYLIREKLISTVPWDDVGSFVRFSATFEAADEREEDHILQEIDKRLSDVEFVF